METKIKLDYTLKTAEERKALVDEIVKQTPPDQLTEKYKEILSDYIIFAMDKEEKKKKEIITDNRMITINKRETSYQGLVDKFENGEDGLYNITIDNDKNVLLTHKVSISPKDIAEIPALKDLVDTIKVVEKQAERATGKRKFALKKTLIEMHQEQYTIKNAARQVSYSSNTAKTFARMEFPDKIYIDKTTQLPVNDGPVSFFNPQHISALLCNYSALKQESRGKFDGDCYYMMEDLDDLIDDTLRNKFPIYYDLLVYKINGMTNLEIQEMIEHKYGIKHSVEYISSLWRNKIPKMLAEAETKHYLD